MSKGSLFPGRHDEPCISRRKCRLWSDGEGSGGVKEFLLCSSRETLTKRKCNGRCIQFWTEAILARWLCGSGLEDETGQGGSEPVSWVLAVAAWGTAVAVGLVGVLVGVLVALLLFHVVVVSTAATVLRARGAPVPPLVCSFIVVVLVWGHQVAPFVGGGVVPGVVGMPCFLLLLVLMYKYHIK